MNGKISLGFLLNGAIWTDHEGCGDRVYVINEHRHDDPKFNCYYTPKMGAAK
jgi:hypothetical protein